jgi:hypothetical protein
VAVSVVLMLVMFVAMVVAAALLVTMLMAVVPMIATPQIFPIFRPVSMLFMPDDGAFGPLVAVVPGFADVSHSGFLVRFVV